MNLYISILKYFITCCVLHATVEGQELSGKLDNIIWTCIWCLSTHQVKNQKYVYPGKGLHTQK